MVAKVVQVVVTPVLQVEHQTLVLAEHKLLAARVAFPSTVFRALQEPNTQVEILATNLAAAVVVTSAAVVVAITVVAVAVQAISTRAPSLTLSHRQERSMFLRHQQVSSTLFHITAMEIPAAQRRTIVNSLLQVDLETLNQIPQG
jgi:hypothetical protein